MKNNNDKKVRPAFCYPNADTLKAKILLNNKKKPGIYRKLETVLWVKSIIFLVNIIHMKQEKR